MVRCGQPNKTQPVEGKISQMNDHVAKSSRKMTMAELAKLADVDVSTVSRALNDSPLVKEETKKQIMKIAAETGYAVNASARNLRRQSSEALGIVIPSSAGVRSDDLGPVLPVNGRCGQQGRIRQRI